MKDLMLEGLSIAKPKDDSKVYFFAQNIVSQIDYLLSIGYCKKQTNNEIRKSQLFISLDNSERKGLLGKLVDPHILTKLNDDVLPLPFHSNSYKGMNCPSMKWIKKKINNSDVIYLIINMKKFSKFSTIISSEDEEMLLRDTANFFMPINNYQIRPLKKILENKKIYLYYNN